MTLHPIRVLNEVLLEYREYLLTEFRAKDPDLRASLERELDEPTFLAQEPFYQAHRPFRGGKSWRELAIDPKLAGVMERRSGSRFAPALPWIGRWRSPSGSWRCLPRDRAIRSW